MSPIAAGLGKILLISSVITGIAYPVTTSLTSSKQSDETNDKNCVIFLKDTKDIFKVLSCQGPNNTKIWYLFNSTDKSLSRIDGLTTNDDTQGKPKKETDDFWNTKNWTGYTKGSMGRISPIGSLFAIKFDSKLNPFKFPFFDYLASVCTQRKEDSGVIFSLSCRQKFNIPVTEFDKPTYSNSFESHGENKCYVRQVQENNKVSHWEEKECSLVASEKQLQSS